MRVTPLIAYGYSLGPAVHAGDPLPPSTVIVRGRTPPEQAAIDLQLRALYDGLLRRPAPCRLVDLVRSLPDAKGAPESSAPVMDGLDNQNLQAVRACVATAP